MLQRYVTVFALVSPLIAIRSADPLFLPRSRKAGQNSNFSIPFGCASNDNNQSIPSWFNARTQWPECEDIIGVIQEQGDCESSWAISAVSAMSDRICIHSKGKIKVNVSAQDVLSCCEVCGGCGGGYLGMAWWHWVMYGIATGGGYNSTKGCKAYLFPPATTPLECQSKCNTPDCSSTCDDGSLPMATFTFGKTCYLVPRNERQIQLEIMMNGPVDARFIWFKDFSQYKKGIYEHKSGTMLGYHYGKICGWGVEKGVPYWFVANTKGTTWGEKGYFRIRRGENECGIEHDIAAGLPKDFSPNSSPPNVSDHSSSTFSFKSLNQITIWLTIFFATLL